MVSTNFEVASDASRLTGISLVLQSQKAPFGTGKLQMDSLGCRTYMRSDISDLACGALS